MNKNKEITGIDVSKSSLDVFSNDKKYSKKNISNVW